MRNIKLTIGQLGSAAFWGNLCSSSYYDLSCVFFSSFYETMSGWLQTEMKGSRNKRKINTKKVWRQKREWVQALISFFNTQVTKALGEHVYRVIHRVMSTRQVHYLIRRISTISLFNKVTIESSSS